MKRFFSFLSIGLVFLLCFSLVGCKTEMEKRESNISELRSAVYVGGNDTMTVTAITGKREEPYVIDGHCSGVRDFTVIKIEPKQFDAGRVYSYAADLDGTQYTGQFVRHPFGKSFSADIEAVCTQSSITVTVSTDGAEEEFVLNSVVTEDMISAEKALEIASARLKKEIASLTSGGELCAEIYVRLMANPIDNSGEYMWYIAYVGEGQTTYAALINPRTMEIVAVRD